MHRPSRRHFLKTSASLAMTAPWVRLNGLAQDKLNVACIGVGGMGGSDLRSVASGAHVRIVGLCDTDRGRLETAAKDHPDARTFQDFRRLFDAMEKDIDAVVVSTPDHTHGPIAISALRRKKHVYCQKPIAHNLFECQLMTRLANEHQLVTQMGTQIHSHEAYKTAVSLFQSGVIGKAKEAHLWVSKSWAGPKEGRPEGSDEVPSALDWDLWLGPAAERPYVKGAYHPARWRGWVDFGCGTLGDMGCHIFDPVFSALELGAPSQVCSKGPQHTHEVFAADSDIQYEFPATRHTVGAIPFRWTDGRNQSRPDDSRAQLPEGVNLPGAGSFIVGEKGVMVIPHWSMPQLYSEGRAMEVDVKATAGCNHYHEWTDACRGEGETSTPFSYSGPLTEAVLVGTIAGHYRNETIAWDSEKRRFDKDPANDWVTRRYRDGWEVQG